MDAALDELMCSERDLADARAEMLAMYGETKRFAANMMNA